MSLGHGAVTGADLDIHNFALQIKDAINFHLAGEDGAPEGQVVSFKRSVATLAFWDLHCFSLLVFGELFDMCLTDI